LDATLLVARYEESIINSDELLQQGIKDFVSKTIKVTTFGDGIIAGLRNDGIIVAHHINFPSNHPQYLNYRLNADRQARLMELEGKNRPWLSQWTLRPNAEPERVQSVRNPDSEEDWNVFFFPTSDFKMVAIFSDGVESFTDSNLNAIPWQTVVSMMMDIPLPQGEFIQRQVNWLVKEIAKKKWQNADDFSMGALNI
jgi:hypothetical protein